MAYFGVIFFANMGVGGGQNYFQFLAWNLGVKFSASDTRTLENVAQKISQISRHLWQIKTKKKFTSTLLQGSCSEKQKSSPFLNAKSQANPWKKSLKFHFSPCRKRGEAKGDRQKSVPKHRKKWQNRYTKKWPRQKNVSCPLFRTPLLRHSEFFNAKSPGLVGRFARIFFAIRVRIANILFRTSSTTTRDRNLQFRGAVSTGGSPLDFLLFLQYLCAI